MTRVLIAWELGSGLGHVGRLSPIVNALRRSGCTVTVAARDPALAARMWGDVVPVVVAPPWTFRQTGQPSGSLADVLLNGGFGDPAVVTPKLKAWRALMDEVRPDLVVGDFSPAATVAARGSVPVVTLGSGYSVPPAGPLTPYQASPSEVDTTRHREAMVLDGLNRGVRRLGLSPVDHLSQALRGDSAQVLTWRPLDPYAAVRSAATLTPYTLTELPTYRRFTDRPEHSLFVYLPQTHPQLPAILEAIGTAGLRGLAYLRGSSLPRRTPPGLTMLNQPADMAEVLPHTRILVHAGGLGLAHAGLASGVVQILFPTCQEQRLTALALARLQIAAAFSAPCLLDGDQIVAALKHAEGRPAVADRLDRLAARCPTDGAKSLHRVLAAIRAASDQRA